VGWKKIYLKMVQNTKNFLKENASSLPFIRGTHTLQIHHLEKINKFTNMGKNSKISESGETDYISISKDPMDKNDLIKYLDDTPDRFQPIENPKMNKIRNDSNSSDSTKSTTISNQTSCTESIIIKIVFSVFTLCAGLIIAVSVWKIKTQDLTSTRLFKNITCDKNSGNSSAVFEPVVSQCCDEKFCYCAKKTRTSRCFDEKLRETVVIEPFPMSIKRRENSQLNRNCEQELKLNEMTRNTGFHNVNSGICVRQHTELLAKSAKIINTKTKEIVDKMVIPGSARGVWVK